MYFVRFLFNLIIIIIIIIISFSFLFVSLFMCIEIGAGFASFGIFFLVLGILLFFDTALLVLGNLLFVLGITLLLGIHKTLIFFSRPGKTKGTVCFMGGILLILMKWY